MIIIFGCIGVALPLFPQRQEDTRDGNHVATGGVELGGSAALQAVSAARCGAKVSVSGTIGNDVLGKLVTDTLRREGINTTALAKTDHLQTGVTTIITEKNPKESRIISVLGANQDSSAAQISSEALNMRTLLLLQNDVHAEINVDILRRARSHDAKSLLSLSGTQNITEELLTLADSTLHREVLDIPDAGFDCYCGTLAACLQAGMERDQAEHYAKIAATLCAGNGGGYAGLPYLDEIEGNL